MAWCHLQQLKYTCVEILYLREVRIHMLQLFVPFPPLSSFPVVNMLWQNIPKWKQSPLNFPRRVHENRRPKLLTLWMWHMGDIFRAKGRGGVGRKMETPDFIPLETLNLLDSILSTGSSKAGLTDPPGVAHTGAVQVHLSATCDWNAGRWQCLQDTCFQTVPLKDVDIDGMLERLMVPLAWTVKHLQRQMGFTWQKWTWVVGLIQLGWSWWSLCGDCTWEGRASFHEESVKKFSL